MRTLAICSCLMASLLLIVGCSSTKMTGSWKDPDYSRRIDRVYIIGMSSQELNRRLFEDRFAEHLASYGVTSFVSYKDLPDIENTDRGTIEQQVQAHRADTLLMTRVINKRTEKVVNPGYSSYRAWPYYNRSPYSPAPYYHNYWSYFDHRYDMLYVPPTVSRYQVVTAECNLYQAGSGELIWAAQVETVVDRNFQKKLNEFIETVIHGMSEDGLL
ncbi:MAG TPA: hypothetical protein VJ910_12630 [Desulfuromonadales bacterium]|nr:hypothetical protein [Desulfuromonadales bacterium]